MSTNAETPVIPPLSHPAVARAVEWLHANDERTLTWQMELTAIPAPPFGEGPRGERLRSEFARHGLTEIRVDEVGNVLGLRPGTEEGHPLIVSAHLDTVFGEETPIEVRRDGDLLEGPGISDDGRGLAALVALAAALNETDVRTRRPLLFVGTVGEEGIGDLRGVKHLFRDGGPGRSAVGFISLDGAGIRRIVSRGVGSYRFRATFHGRGGHSWVDFGLPNPLHGLGTAIAEWTSLELPRSPTTTLTVARTGGGTAINAIPQEAWAEVDLRSEEDGVLRELRETLHEIAESAAERHSTGAPEASRLTVDIRVLGERPAGRCPSDAELLSVARAATRAVEVEPKLVASSTDANVAMSLAIPALTLGAGGEADLAHTPEEWYRNERGVEGIVRALLTVLGTAGLDED